MKFWHLLLIFVVSAVVMLIILPVSAAVIETAEGGVISGDAFGNGLDNAESPIQNLFYRGQETLENVAGAIKALLTVTVKFPFATLQDSVLNVVKSAYANMIFGGNADYNQFGSFTNGFGGARISFLQTMDDTIGSVINWLFSPATFLTSIRESGWRVCMNIAYVLIPLVLILSIGSSLRNGAASVTGSADAREAIVSLLVSIGLSVSSLWIFTQLINLSSAIASRLYPSTGQIVSAMFSNSFFVYGGVTSPVLIFLFITVTVFLILAVCVSLVISSAALQAAYVVLTVLSPIVFVISAFDPLNWLRKLWIKGTAITMLLSPINAIMILIMVETGNKLARGGTPGNIFMSLGIYLACCSILISLNGMLGKFIFAAAGTAIQHGADSGAKILGAGVSAAGFVGGGGLSPLANSGGMIQPSSGGGGSSLSGFTSGLSTGPNNPGLKNTQAGSGSNQSVREALVSMGKISPTAKRFSEGYNAAQSFGNQARLLTNTVAGSDQNKGIGNLMSTQNLMNQFQTRFPSGNIASQAQIIDITQRAHGIAGQVMSRSGISDISFGAPGATEAERLNNMRDSVLAYTMSKVSPEQISVLKDSGMSLGQASALDNTYRGNTDYEFVAYNVVDLIFGQRYSAGYGRPAEDLISEQQSLVELRGLSGMLPPAKES